MTSADTYRVKAAELSALARREAIAARKAEYETLALSYLRLAEQADRNSRTNIVYETPTTPADRQQQQQIQPKKKG